MIRRSFRAAAVLLVVGVLGAAAFVATARSDAPVRVDAVLVHIGGEGERIDLAMDIWESSAEFLVIPTGEDWDVDDRLCGTDPRIVCEPIEPETTLGESRLLAELTEREGWDSVATVTTDYHLRRASILDRRCSPVPVATFGAEDRIGPVELVGKYLHEIGGLALLPFQRCEP